MKHELIYALPASFCELMLSQSKELTEGLYLLPPVNEWTASAENVLFAQRRDTLELDNTARQLNGYLIPRAWDNLLNEWVYFPYMRVEGSGEAGLFNKVSVGYGGHVDLIDGIGSNDNDPSIVYIPNALAKNLQRESGEEFGILHRGTQQVYGNAQHAVLTLTEVAQRAIIITNGRVEDRHIGLITIAEVPFGQEVVAKEAGLVALGPMTARQILELEDVTIEDWTKIFLYNLQPSDLEPPVAGKPPLGQINVSYFGAWANEVAFVRDFVNKPDSAFELYEGEDAMEAVERILKDHIVSGFMTNCVYGRKLISSAAIASVHDIGRPLFELLARPDEATAIMDAAPEQDLSTVAPLTVDLIRDVIGVPHLNEGQPVVITRQYLENQLLNIANELLASEHKLKFLRILSITHETEQTRHRQAQQRTQFANPNLTRAVAQGQTPQGIPADLLNKLAAAGGAN